MRKADNLPPYRAVVMKSGSLNFLEPSGPVMGELYFTLIPRSLCWFLQAFLYFGFPEDGALALKHVAISSDVLF